MTDDVGIWKISAYHRGMMGGSTPNIDRIAKEYPSSAPPSSFGVEQALKALEEGYRGAGK